MFGKLTIRAKDSVFDPRLPREGDPTLQSSSLKVHAKERQGGRRHYKVYLYLEGEDLPYIRRVVYRLHSTFKNPTRAVPRTASNPNCLLELWTWGVFTVNIQVEDKRGQTYAFTHRLKFDQELPNNEGRYKVGSW